MNHIFSFLYFLIPHFATEEYYATYDSQSHNFIIGVPYDPNGVIQTKYDYIVELKFLSLFNKAYFIAVSYYEEL